MLDKNLKVSLQFMEQSQGHQTWYELVDPKQSYNNVNFESPHLHIVREKANDHVFVESGNNFSYFP